MPTISFRTKVKAAADLYAVTLNVRHCLVSGNPSVTYHTITRIPENVDVLASNLPITISGSFDGCEASSLDIVASSLAKYLASYFRKVIFNKYSFHGGKYDTRLECRRTTPEHGFRCISGQGQRAI